MIDIEIIKKKFLDKKVLLLDLDNWMQEENFYNSIFEGNFDENVWCWMLNAWEGIIVKYKILNPDYDNKTEIEIEVLSIESL